MLEKKSSPFLREENCPFLCSCVFAEITVTLIVLILFISRFSQSKSIEACRYQQHLNSVDNYLKEKFDDIKRTVYSQPCSTQQNFSSFPLTSEEKYTRSPDEVYQAMLQKRKWYLNNRAEDFPKKLVTTPDDTTKSIKVNLTNSKHISVKVDKNLKQTHCDRITNLVQKFQIIVQIIVLYIMYATKVRTQEVVGRPGDTGSHEYVWSFIMYV